MIFFQKTFSKSLLALSERFPFLIAGAKVAIKSKFASLLLNIFRNYYIFLIIGGYTYINIYKGRESKTSGDMWVKWIYYTQNDRQTLLNYL